MTTYFTADTHIGHANILQYCNRPFKTVEEMDEIIVENTVNTLKPGDLLFHLGDLTFKPIHAHTYLQLLSQLGVRLIYIRGNHDKNIVKVIKRAGIEVHELYSTKFDGQTIVMCHYAMRVWEKSHWGSWQLYGHSHGTLPPEGKQYDVGVDNNNFELVPLEKIIEIMTAAPPNINQLEAYY